jgi:NADH-quinone oxidoreductase subunit J
MLVLRHPMRVALALVATMLSLAGVYALLGVHVIAVFQVLIYVGAGDGVHGLRIMLLDVRDRAYTRRYSRLLLPGIAAAVPVSRDRGACAVARAAADGGRGGGGAMFGLRVFSLDFLNEYWLHFELVSVLLVAAVVAALAVLEVGRRPVDDLSMLIATSWALFALGLVGVIVRRNVLIMLMCMELMLNGVNLSLVAFAQQAATSCRRRARLPGLRGRDGRNRHRHSHRAPARARQAGASTSAPTRI